MYVCMYVFIKLHITTQSGPVILVILCHYECIKPDNSFLLECRPFTKTDHEQANAHAPSHTPNNQKV